MTCAESLVLDCDLTPAPPRLGGQAATKSAESLANHGPALTRQKDLAMDRAEPVVLRYGQARLVEQAQAMALTKPFIAGDSPAPARQAGQLTNESAGPLAPPGSCISSSRRRVTKPTEPCFASRSPASAGEGGWQ